MFFSVITKNLTEKFYLRICFLLKDGIGLRMKNSNIMEVHWKIPFFRHSVQLNFDPIFLGITKSNAKIIEAKNW